MIKIVLDTNIFISGLFFPKSNAGKLLNSCFEKRYNLCLSEELIMEIEISTGVLQDVAYKCASLIAQEPCCTVELKECLELLFRTLPSTKSFLLILGNNL